MNRTAIAAALLALFAAHGATPLQAAPAPAVDTNIVIDPAIARASAEADAKAGNTPAPDKAGHEVVESPQTPYAKALLNYKSGKYAAAKALIDQADEEQPGNVPIEMLKARILVEQHDFTAAHKMLGNLYDRSDLTPAYASALTLATGDLALRQHQFDQASKAYQSYLQTQPADSDAKLKLIYARIGANDFIAAGKYASELKPLDASTPAYYFARAALAHSNGDNEAEQDIEQARTIYGITLANRYLKTYLEVFSDDKAPAPATKASSKASPPSGRAQ